MLCITVRAEDRRGPTQRGNTQTSHRRRQDLREGCSVLLSEQKIEEVLCNEQTQTGHRRRQGLREGCSVLLSEQKIEEVLCNALTHTGH